MLIKELKEILQDQAHIFKDTYFEISQIHLITLMYGFKHINHDILLNFSFEIFANSFWVSVISVSNIFHV